MDWPWIAGMLVLAFVLGVVSCFYLLVFGFIDWITGGRK